MARDGEQDRVQHPVTEHLEEVSEVLDAIEHLVRHARGVPMSASVLVGRDELLELVRQARQVLPTELSEADGVLARADEVRARAEAQAQEVLAEARRRAEQLVETEAVAAAARTRAEEILAEARQVAEEMRREADDYCDRRLADFEIDLGRVLAQVQAGRAKLAGRLGEE